MPIWKNNAEVIKFVKKHIDDQEYVEDILEYINGANLQSFSNPIEWNGDSEFGRCDITGMQGSICPMVCLDLKGDSFEFECLDSVAYVLHGLAGAY